jgi:hypothetical protein
VSVFLSWHLSFILSLTDVNQSGILDRKESFSIDFPAVESTGCTEKRSSYVFWTLGIIKLSQWEWSAVFHAVLLRLAAQYGNLDVSQCLRSAKITVLHVNDLAQVYREKIRLQLVEPSDGRCLAFNPDLWANVYRQISVLGITAWYVESNIQSWPIDLCRSSYCEPNKSAESINAVRV